MPRRTGLTVAASRPDPHTATAAPATADLDQVQPPATPKRTRTPANEKPAGSRYAGQLHVGASYDENDDTVESFRALAFKTRRSHKDLLHEAMRLLVDKHDSFKAK